jgi:hypothetical protein
VGGACDLRLSGWPERIDCDVEATLKEFDVDAFQAAWTPEETAWLMPIRVRSAYAAESAAPSITGEGSPPAPPENLTVRFRATADRVRTRGYTLESCRAQGTLSGQRLDAPELEGKLGGGDVRGHATVDWTVDPPRWDSNVRAEAVPAADLVHPFAEVLARCLSTQVTGDLELGGPLGVETDVLRAHLDGEGAIQTGAGQLLTEPILGATIPRFLGLLGTSFENLDFRQLTAGLRVQGGRVHFDTARAVGATLVEASGWVGLAGQCDYRLSVKLPPGATPDLGDLSPVADLLRDDEQRITFQAAVTGPAGKPKVQIDMRDLQDRAASGAADAARSELDRLLDDVLSPDGSSPDSTQAGQESDLKDKAEDALNDLLKGFGGKKGEGGKGG